MVQIIPQGDIFGRIGESIGEGFSKQLPQELDRTRLSQGLTQMEQSGQNLSPVQLMGRMLSIPGMRPEYITALYPMMQAEMNRRARTSSLKDSTGQADNAGQPITSTDGILPGSSTTPAPGKVGQVPINAQTEAKPTDLPIDREKTLSTKYGLPTKVFKTAGEQRAMMQPEPIYTTQKQIENEAKFSNLPPEEARVEAKALWKQQEYEPWEQSVKSGETKEAAFKNIRNGIRDALSDSLQVPEDQVDNFIPSDLRKVLENDAIDLVNSGVPWEKVTTDIGKLANTFTHSRDSVRSGTMKGMMDFFNPSAGREQLEQKRKAYSDIGGEVGLELLRNDLQEKANGFSALGASVLAMPASSGVTKALDKVPSITQLIVSGMGPHVTSNIKQFEKSKDATRNAIPEIIKQMTPTDSFNTLVWELYSKKNVSDLVAISAIHDAINDPEIASHLTRRQIDEARNLSFQRRNVNDIWYGGLW